MMFCKKCGKPIAEGSDICLFCWEPVPPEDLEAMKKAAKKEKKKSSKTKVIIPVIVFLVIAAVAVFVFLSGGTEQLAPQENNAPTAEQDSSEYGIVTEPAKNNSSDFVDKGLLTVDFTLPKDLFMGQTPSTELTAEQKNQGYISASLNSDGSITYKITKSGYNALVQETKQSTEKSLKEIATSGDFPSVKQVKYNNDFSKITLLVNRAEYESSFDSMACMSVALIVGFYEAVADKKPDCTVSVVDMNTNEVFYTYPEK